MPTSRVPAPVRGEDGWDYACFRCPWTTRGWSTKRAATSRRDEHELEHATGEPMSELADVKDRP